MTFDPNVRRLPRTKIPKPRRSPENQGGCGLVLGVPFVVTAALISVLTRKRV